MSTDQCSRCRYADGGSKQGLLCINVDDFLIGLSDGVLVKNVRLKVNRCVEGK